MKRSLLVLLAALLPLGTIGCGGGPRVSVHTAVDAAGTEGLANLADLPVRLVPYDRDAIFDSLEAAYPEPQPAIPQDILEQQQAVQAAQTDWRTAEERWGTVRDSLRTLANEMQRMQQQGLRGTPQYTQAFRRFEQLEGEERQVRQNMDASFARFDQMQRTVLTRADSVRSVREAWGDRAYTDFDRVVDARLQQTGRQEYADTTNAEGLVRFRAPRGRWWVYARYTLPYEELYWNIPIEVAGDSVRVELRRDNAEVRPVM
ncbi:hypothetical protein BH24GEM3_BH24GEM3_11770 [soil metagenome]|jgi:hypothetical protein|nr:hypothetical protein [Gemmatimonadota bacterium]